MWRQLQALRALFPLNLVSLLTLSLSGWLLASYGMDDHILYVALWLLNAVIGLMALIVLIEALYVRRWTRRLEPLSSQELEVGQESLTGLSLPALGPSALAHVKLSWSRPQLASYELISTGKGLEELVAMKRRGRLAEVERVVTVEDLFGFCTLSWRWRQPAAITTLPRSASVSATPLQQLQEGEDLYQPEGQPEGDLTELRRYQEGDPLKLVAWSLYARSGQLMVRAPERALSLKRDLVSYVLADPSDEPSASTVRAYLERGLLGDNFELYADGCAGAAQSGPEVIEHLLGSAEAEPLEALPQLLALPPQRQRGCVVFASASSPIDALLQVSRALSAPPLFVLSFPELAEPVQQRALLSYLLKEEQSSLWEGALSAQDLERGYHALIAEGARVLLISQPEGRLVSEFELQRMAEGA